MLIHLAAAQTAIVQNLQYYEHLSEPMAEFLQILAEQYDYPHLADEILRYVNHLSIEADHQGSQRKGVQ
jgi:condensin complex subunit 1